MDARRTFALVIFVTSTAFLVACSSARPAGTGPAYASEAGLLARDTCFGIEHLPPHFEVLARQIIDNRSASQHPAPSIALEDSQAWQRLNGAWLQYAYEPPSMPAEDADGFLTQDELEQALARAHAERQQAPFSAASCRLDLFASQAGAHAAFQALTSASPGQRLPHRGRGDESVLLLAPAVIPSFARLTLWFRRDTVVAAVSITAACDPTDPASCAGARERTESLAALLLRRIDARVPALAPPPPTAADTRSTIEAHCPERDYTSCVAEALAVLATGEPTTLCISPYGEWRFVPPKPDARAGSCPEEWDAVASFPLASR
ncbi:hypothetical protein OO015_12180 [Thermomicrobium sp. 4228-Ro]|uniref:hypothetical protein n=1 Tax=Thermomicrobium sp. 4228-Ro TaxID=2993937 RepID=UPI002248D9E3|nr:hypothetical protein [Thermomicrobium sp. 4228-Ro]MCX2728248.1 hypothetical protein [Thermomicrobium sp. 4228-Ro]